MASIDYRKVFSKLSHIKALSHDQKFDLIVQNVILHTLEQCESNKPKNERDVAHRIDEFYGISMRHPVILSNLDKLRDRGEIIKDPKSREYSVSSPTSLK